ncbi:MAG TPA: T9SS type A sorting domain-containing protein [Ignavibacteriaceae bacterium]|nr:T9SS type A sorting domain-containing protein [Ignavibacteriaceae bacterium]
MKILIFLTFLSITAFPQDRFHNVLLDGKFIPENLLAMQKSAGYNLERLNNRESFLLRSQSNNIDGYKAIQQRDIYKEVLDNGFYLIESIYQSWNGFDWKDSIKSSYTYENSNLIEIIDRSWDGSVWTNSLRTSYIYNLNDDIINFVMQTWDDSVWVNSMRISYTYDSNNYPIEAIEQLWVASDWMNDWKYSYYYNGNNLEEILSQVWDVSEWMDGQRALYTFDTNNNLNEVLFQYYSDTYLDWVDFMKCSYTYDSRNNIIEELWQGFTGSQWVNGMKSSFTYDVNNYLIEELDQNWNDVSWENDLKYSDSYDENYNLIVELVQSWNGSDWVNNGKYLNAYNPLTAVDEDSNSPNSFNLSDNYPNPFNPATKIIYSIPEKSIVSLKVYDLLGSEIASLVSSEVEAGKHEVNFNAVNLPSGVYLYQLKAGNYTNTKKMLLIK